MKKKKKKAARRKKPPVDLDREDRIHMEIVADSFNEYELVARWYGYLENQIEFPFTATCSTERQISPLDKGDEVEVLEMAEPDECRKEMMVVIRLDVRKYLAIPLSQLKPTSEASPATIQAVDDWCYWADRGYEF